MRNGKLTVKPKFVKASILQVVDLQHEFHLIKKNITQNNYFTSPYSLCYIPVG
jgi:hypothetical protein